LALVAGTCGTGRNNRKTVTARWIKSNMRWRMRHHNKEQKWAKFSANLEFARHTSGPDDSEYHSNDVGKNQNEIAQRRILPDGKIYGFGLKLVIRHPHVAARKTLVLSFENSRPAQSPEQASKTPRVKRTQ
jgi:hypothetical protein